MDNFFILMETNEKNAQMLKQILDLYCDSSGQLVSDAKSNIYFSPNTPVEERVVLCQILKYCEWVPYCQMFELTCDGGG
jgi:hypothetical protein